MTQFTVSVPAVSVAAAATSDATERLAAQVQRLRGDVEAVLGGHWSGAAATAFEQAWREWHAGAVTVVRTLRELADRLGESGRCYAASDTDGAERFGRLVL